jgi:hypothetical protein
VSKRIKVGYVRIKEVRGRVRIEPLSREEIVALLREGSGAGQVKSGD